MTTDLKNGKIYIGQHRVQSKSTQDNWYFGGGKVIEKIIKDGGRERLTRDILAECNSQDDADALERFFIEAYSSTDPNIGYNRSGGGRYSHESNFEWIQKNDVKRWQKVREQMSESGKNSPTQFKLGHKLSPESIRKMKAHLPKRYKAVRSITTGKVYNSLQMAAKDLGKPSSSGLSDCLAGRAKHWAGQDWEYV